MSNRKIMANFWGGNPAVAGSNLATNLENDLGLPLVSMDIDGNSGNTGFNFSHYLNNLDETYAQKVLEESDKNDEEMGLDSAPDSGYNSDRPRANQNESFSITFEFLDSSSSPNTKVGPVNSKKRKSPSEDISKKLERTIKQRLRRRGISGEIEQLRLLIQEKGERRLSQSKVLVRAAEKIEFLKKLEQKLTEDLLLKIWSRRHPQETLLKLKLMDSDYPGLFSRLFPS